LRHLLLTLKLHALLSKAQLSLGKLLLSLELCFFSAP
jgi:hypothetical protein